MKEWNTLMLWSFLLECLPLAFLCSWDALTRRNMIRTILTWKRKALSFCCTPILLSFVENMMIANSIFNASEEHFKAEKLTFWNLWYVFPQAGQDNLCMCVWGFIALLTFFSNSTTKQLSPNQERMGTSWSKKEVINKPKIDRVLTFKIIYFSLKWERLLLHEKWWLWKWGVGIYHEIKFQTCGCGVNFHKLFEFMVENVDFQKKEKSMSDFYGWFWKTK